MALLAAIISACLEVVYSEDNYTVNEYPLYLSRVDVLNVAKWRQGAVDAMWSKQELKVPRHDLACAFHDHKICFAGGMSKEEKLLLIAILHFWGNGVLGNCRSHAVIP